MEPFAQPLLTASLPCWVIGHRGAAVVCPENTVDSFCVARDAGASMVELDVQQSTDGELLVFHDATLQRVCGESQPIAALSWEALSTRVVGHWQGCVLQIPRLAEVFSTLRRSVFYNVELKTNIVPYAGIEARLVELVRACGLTERVLVSSFHHDSLRLVRRHDTDLPLGLLLDLAQAQDLHTSSAIIARAQEFACFSVHPDFRFLRSQPTVVDACHAVGLRVFPWTVDDPQDWRFLVDELHVDGIITNDPGRLYDWLLAHQITYDLKKRLPLPSVGEG